MNITAITIWREARGEGTPGMVGVYWVIANRAASKRNIWPSDPEKVCLQAYQFSCWNTNDPQRDLYPRTEDPQYAMAYAIVQSPGSDPTMGATGYYDLSLPTPPSWATPQTFTVQIGRLRFHKI
jgi:spore germination cell wall hydrolase CwlJ-like protein